MNENTNYPTLLAEAVWPQASLVREIALVLTGSWLIALAAQIEIPLWPVPITGQTFGVLLVAALLGSRRGALTVMSYLLQGAMGLPVFAGGTAGIVKFAGPTGGYLIGFVMAAFVVGWLSEQGWDRNIFTTAIAMLVGNIVIYVFGLPWLANFIGWETVLKAGFLPFITGDLIKIALSALVLPLGWTLIDTQRTS
ncbi:MAG: biotin transporter BioY [Chloroflexi bacterium]|nr:biotin transporter BioY [Chloroflexota bacterium]